MNAFRASCFAGALCVAVPAAAGDVTGSVSFLGSTATPPPLKVTKDESVCGRTVPDDTIEVANGKLANVVVTLRGLPAWPLKERVVIDQQQCRYVPHVQAAPVGSVLEIVNSDPLLHNIHGYLGQATAFNFAMPYRNQTLKKALRTPGVVRVKCDVHSWMSAFVVVVDGPAVVTGPDGTFAIRGLPAGTYTITAWHEKLGEKTAQVQVPASGEATLSFAFGS